MLPYEEKGNFFKQCFYQNNKTFGSINSYNRCSNVVIIVLPLVYCPVDDTLFELGPEVRCSGV